MFVSNYAFIDSQNLFLSVKKQWRDIDFARLFVFLKHKYRITKAFLFIWYYHGNESLYQKLQEAGYVVIFKPTLQLKDGTIKWNVDAELVLHTMIQYSNFDKAILITWDWDFYCLVEYLKNQDKLEKVLIPNRHKYSQLLRKFKDNLIFLSDMKLREKLENKKK